MSQKKEQVWRKHLTLIVFRTVKRRKGRGTFRLGRVYYCNLTMAVLVLLIGAFYLDYFKRLTRKKCGI